MTKWKPVIEYACPLFPGSPKSHIAPLQQIQNRAVRAATSDDTKAKTPQLISERHRRGVHVGFLQVHI